MADVLQFRGTKVEGTKVKVNEKLIAKEVNLMKEQADSYSGDLIPVEEWDGECWQEFFNTACKGLAEATGKDPWDIFAAIVNDMLKQASE